MFHSPSSTSVLLLVLLSPDSPITMKDPRASSKPKRNDSKAHASLLSSDAAMDVLRLCHRSEHSWSRHQTAAYGDALLVLRSAILWDVLFEIRRPIRIAQLWNQWGNRFSLAETNDDHRSIILHHNSFKFRRARNTHQLILPRRTYRV
ncbi:hypothetical protein PM082_009993 [Marasmius tenuissimus]|nr:hypothetical protein PM082_009993 [Marasmius tenuissimus]